MANRNVWCPYYSACLDQACEANQPFDCDGCEFETDQSGKAKIDFFTDKLLIVAVFFPQIYKLYCRYRINTEDETARRKLEQSIDLIQKLVKRRI